MKALRNNSRKIMVWMVGLLLLMFDFAIVLGASQPQLPKVSMPFLITTAGQSVDGEFVKILSDRAGLKGKYKYEMLAEPADLAGIKALLLVIGGSGKGLGAAGIDVSKEEARVLRLLAAAKKTNILVVGMHIGGEARRGPISANFVPYAAKCGYLIIKGDGNADGYFTKISKDQKIPMYTFTQTLELQDVLKTMFGVK